MRSTRYALGLLMLAALPADAGVFKDFWAKQEPSLFSRKNRPRVEEVPGGHPPNLVAPNGVEVPAWASKRMREASAYGPLYGQSWGRRPWAMPLSNEATPSANMARANQLGFAPGAIPGYTNDYGGAGNYPMASVGKGIVNGWAPNPNPNRIYMPRPYPFVTGFTGY